MEATADSWIFAIFMCVLVLMIIVKGTKDYLAGRKLPGDPEDKRTNRKRAMENLKFFLGKREKDDKDNPMKHQEGDDGSLFK